MKCKKQSGFTLIEILITVSIIALLSTIIIVGLDAVRAKARDTKRIGDIKQLHGAIENFYSTCYRFPINILEVSRTPVDCIGYSPVLLEIPIDPAPGTGYKYFTDAAGSPLGSGRRFHLCATLEFSYGNGKSKAGKAPFNTGSLGDSCDGRNQYVFDVIGGAY